MAEDLETLWQTAKPIAATIPGEDLEALWSQAKPVQPETSPPAAQEEPGFVSRVAGAARKTGEFLGMDKITDPFARMASYGMAEPEERAGIGMPSVGEVAGAGLQAAALALPYGRIAGGLTKVAGKVLAPTAARLAGAAGAGATGGYMMEAGEKIQKGEAPIPGATTAIGAAIPPALAGVGKGISKTVEVATKAIPVRMMNSLVKPLLRDFSYGKNPGRVLAEEGVIANSFDDLVAKIPELRKNIGERLGSVAGKLDEVSAGKGIKLNVSSAVTPIDDAMREAATQNNQALVDKLGKVKAAITERLTLGADEAGQPIVTSAGKRNLSSIGFNEAIGIKREIGDMTKWTGNFSDDNAINAAQKKVWGRIKAIANSEADKADPQLAAEFRKLNEKYADITSADVAVKHRDKILERQNLMSLPGKLGLGGAVLATVLSGGSILPGMIAGASVTVIDKALGSTAVKTRIATWLAKASPAEVGLLQRKAPKVYEAMRARFPGDILFKEKAPAPIRNARPRGPHERIRPEDLPIRPGEEYRGAMPGMGKADIERQLAGLQRPGYGAKESAEFFAGQPMGTSAVESAQALRYAPEIDLTKKYMPPTIPGRGAKESAETFARQPSGKSALESAIAFEQDFPWSTMETTLPINAAKIKTGSNIEVKEMINSLIKDNRKSAAESAKIMNQIPVYGKTVVNLSPSHEATIKSMIDDISMGEAGKRIPTEGGWRGIPSTFPDYFQNKGLLKKDVLSVMNKAINGEPVTKQEWRMVSELNNEFRKSLVPRIMKERREMQNAFPWGKGERNSRSLSDLSDKELIEAIRSESGSRTELVAELKRRRQK